MAQQPRPAAARPARPVHQTRPLLGHRRRRGGDEHRRDRRGLAGEPTHRRSSRCRRGNGGNRAARAQRGQPDADRGSPAARPRATDVVHAVARRGGVDGAAMGPAVARPGGELRPPDALHVRLPDCCRRRRGDDRVRRPPSPGSRSARPAGPARCRGDGGVLGAATVGSALCDGQCQRRIRSVRRFGAVGRSIEGLAHPRRIGVSPAVRRSWVDGRPLARGITPVASPRRGRPRRVERRTRRCGGGDAAAPPRPCRDGDRRDRGVRRIRAGGDQDPAHRAVRHHRPELLLDLADRRVHGDVGRRQRAADAVSAFA